MVLSEEEYIEKCKRLSIMKQQLDSKWSKCENFQDLISINKMYIQKEVTIAPYYLGPMDNPSTVLICDLVKLHNIGILTTNGQESRCMYGIKKKNYFIDKEQRGYLAFHIDLLKNLKLAESFIEQLQTLDIIYTVYNLKTGNRYSNIRDEYYSVTRYRTYEHIEEKKELLKWNNCTFVKKNCTRQEISWKYIETIEKILDNTIFFKLAINDDFGKGNIEKIVLKMYENSIQRCSKQKQEQGQGQGQEQE